MDQEETEKATAGGTTKATPEGTAEAKEEATPEATDGLPGSDSEATGVGTVEETEEGTQPVPREEHPPMNVAPETVEGTGRDDRIKVELPNSDCRKGTIESPSRDDPGVGDTGSHTCKRCDRIKSIIESPDIMTD